jgi:Ni/Co efflux regulator RcnB
LDDQNLVLNTFVELHMNCKTIVCSVAALSMGLSGMAFAQQSERPEDRNASRMQTERPEDRGRAVNPRRAEPAPRVAEMRGAGPDHNWRAGSRLPAEYRGRQYVVSDWRGHHLHAPPQGYQWVQAGPDYVLAAIATGVIASILLNQ